MSVVINGSTGISVNGDPAIIGGKHTIWVPAGAIVPRNTNGASRATIETSTNKIMISSLDFDATTAEYAQFGIRMPKSADEGTVSAFFVWSASATGDCVWGLQAVALGDGDALDSAFGTAQTVTDSVSASTNVMHSAETTAITAAGTPAANDWWVFQVFRDAASGSDTLAVDARLHGIVILYNVSAGNDA